MDDLTQMDDLTRWRTATALQLRRLRHQITEAIDRPSPPSAEQLQQARAAAAGLAQLEHGLVAGIVPATLQDRAEGLAERAEILAEQLQDLVKQIRGEPC